MSCAQLCEYLSLSCITSAEAIELAVLAVSNAMKVLQACIYNPVKAHVATRIAKLNMLILVFTFWCKELQLLNINIMNWTILVAASDFKNCPVFIYILVKTGL